MDPNKKFKFELTWQMVQVISAGLQELPGRVCNPVMADLQKQLDAQTNVVPINPERNDASA